MDGTSASTTTGADFQPQDILYHQRSKLTVLTERITTKPDQTGEDYPTRHLGQKKFCTQRRYCISRHNARSKVPETSTDQLVWF
jgi:hypothetical protein